MERQEEPVTTKQTRRLSNGPFKFIRPLWHFEVRKEWERKERVCEREPSWKAIYHYLLFVVGVGNKIRYIYLAQNSMSNRSLLPPLQTFLSRTAWNTFIKKTLFLKTYRKLNKNKTRLFRFQCRRFLSGRKFRGKNPGAIILQPVVVEWPERRVRYVGGWFNKFESSPQKGTWVKTEGGGERELGGVGAVEISVAHNRSPTDWQNLFGTGFLGPHESHSFLWKWLFLMGSLHR